MFIVLDVRRYENKDYPLKALRFYQRNKPHMREFSSAFTILLPCLHLPYTTDKAVQKNI